MPQTIRGVILDVDGTLVDSNDAHARAWVEALAENGITVSFEEVRGRIGEGGDKLLPEVSGIRTDTPQGKKLEQRRKEIFETRYLPSLRPTPGAHELLEHMHARGLKLVVASSAKKDELTPLLRVCGAEELIEQQTSSDDAEHSKPDPDIVQAALGELGMPAEQVVMLGDTPYDVASASRAGVAVIAFRCGGWSDAELQPALRVYDNPADLLRHYEQSPLA
jgi:HAD superfamily hydrolase (TIGR01509 family)